MTRLERSRPMPSVRGSGEHYHHATKLRVVSLNYARMIGVHRDGAHGLPCMYCWEPMTRTTWDHVIPISKGGPNVRGNLVVVCPRCNCDKGDLSLPEYEGLLLGIKSPIGPRVSTFTAWVTRDWADHERDAFAAIVAQSRDDAVRARCIPQLADTLEVRAALSRMLKSSLGNRAVPLKVPRLRLVRDVLDVLNREYPLGVANA